MSVVANTYLLFTLKNTTTSAITIYEMGLTIAASSSVDLPKMDLQLANSCEDLQSYIASGSIIVNNGTDLTPTQAKQFLNNELEYSGMYALTSHTHTKSQITDFAHTHDDRYYTITQVDAMAAGMNYAWVSSHDGSTNVTGAELEALTNGSNADGLHTHTFPNYANLTLDEAYNHSNGISQINADVGHVAIQPSNGWAPLRLIEVDYTPTQGLGGGGHICVKDDIMYLYDDDRCKWLSVEGYSFQSFSTSSSASGYMSHGNTMNSSYGFTMPFDGTITSMSMSLQNSNASGRFTIRNNGCDVGADIYFSGGSSKFYNDAVDIDFCAGDVLETYIDQTGTKPKYPALLFMVKRRI